MPIVDDQNTPSMETALLSTGEAYPGVALPSMFMDRTVDGQSERVSKKTSRIDKSLKLVFVCIGLTSFFESRDKSISSSYPIVDGR